jgi:hypothetical protein
MSGSTSSVRRSSLGTLLAGLVVVAAYFLLSTFEIGKVGAETDIGGGLILLTGYALTAGGVLMVARDLWHRRSTLR